MYAAQIRPPYNLLPLGLTACAVVAGPSLLHAAQTAPALTLASVAIGLTALLIGLTLRQRGRHVVEALPARRRFRTLSWSPP